MIIRGAREHNLKNVSLSLPREAMIVFTGLSGSGKSSLAFDTIFAEGQRRYVESLSAYARQFLGQMDKPAVDFVEGLSPAVSIDQKSTSRNPRSTVGTITEIYDYLRLLFARIGLPHCQVCGEPIDKQTPQQIVDQLMALPEGTRFQVLAPVVRGRKGEYSELLRGYAGQGFARARVDGIVCALGDAPTLDKQKKHDIDIVVDRLAVKESVQQRLTDSVETALNLTGGVVTIEFVDKKGSERERRFSMHLACPNGHDIAIDELEPRQFSFNGPWGACPSCSGLGTTLEVDPELVVPDVTKSLAEHAIAPWSTPMVAGHYDRVFAGLASQEDFSVDTPWEKLPVRVRRLVLNGVDDPVYVTYRNRFGRTRTYTQHYEGVLPYIRRRQAEAETDSARERWGAYMREIPCATCNGERLKPSSLAVTIGGRNIAQVSSLSIGEVRDYLNGLVLTPREAAIAQRVVKEIHERLKFLLDVGLDYLTLSRAAGSLSGGEAQRIRLATQIGSGLTGVLYVLDEPSIGLHQRDNKRLIETLLHLRDLGNMLIVVEHDEETIRSADWIVDIGPGAGEHGGEIVVSGGIDDLLAEPRSLTGAYLAGRKAIPVPLLRRPGSGEAITVVDAAENNLRNISVGFPLGKFIAVTGVSGSGKSTLVNLICRFYDVSEGQVLIDGVDVRSLPVAEYRRHIGLVLQEPFLFFGTIADNIAYGKPAATRGEIVAAARAAHAHEFILRLPHGYDSLVGERGQGLSGGERQRISIARALLIDPRILILDEATSAVDTETEREIQTAIDQIAGSRTLIVIAHRLSTIYNAELILVMNHGTIIEQGSHKELMAKGGFYADLYNSQFQEEA